MNKKSIYVDNAFLTIIFLLILLTVYRHFEGGFILSINNYIGFLFYLSVVVLRLRRSSIKRYSVLLLLILSVFNVVNFTVEQFQFNVGTDPQKLTYNSLSINPIALVLLIIYLLLNGSVVKQIYSDSEKEAEVKFNKKINFYFEKFNSFDDKEFKSILDNYDEYPTEAQLALDKLKKIKKLCP